MSKVAGSLDSSFISRALPSGSARYWSHAFAAPTARPALLGVYALCAEWQYLSGLKTESSVAHSKLAWWQGEMTRLVEGKPLHPISLYLAGLPGAAAWVFEPLRATVQAALAQVSGVPLERAEVLQSHATALHAHPFGVAAELAGEDSGRIAECTRALAQAQYRSYAIRHYRFAFRQGRLLFPVDELLAAGIDNGALAAAAPDEPLRDYLAAWRAHALQGFALAKAKLPPADFRYRHLAVVAALGAAHLRPDSYTRPMPLKDMLLAWSAARRASS